MVRESEFEITDPGYRAKVYRRKECHRVGKCDRCPWHGGPDNYGSHRDRIGKSWKWKRTLRWVNIPTV